MTEGLDFVKDAVGTAQEGTSYNVSVKIGEGQAETKAATLSGENNRIMTLIYLSGLETIRIVRVRNLQ